MKRQLAILASSLVVGVGAIAVAPVQALPIFGTESHHELEDILNEEVQLSGEQQGTLIGVAGLLEMDSTALLNSPDAMNSLFDGESVDPSQPPTGPLVINHEASGCSVDAGCALKAIGLVNTLKCGASGMDPEAWASCLQDTDYDAYIAASACTWGSCPGFALAEDGVYACAEPTGLSVFAALN
ncbi:hypothetical protein [Sodalinema gerasimenkoae]|uniref:hypothetical protein n=1 Tax=Sodalinema gerasimenkoae TaxID=2862348 RepID=UPI00135BAF95|nr:hypothetical protein [Sodalinema gerasimenkoae]